MKENLKDFSRVALIFLVASSPIACSSNSEDPRICIGNLKQSEFNRKISSASNNLIYDDKDLISVRPIMYDSESFPNGVKSRLIIQEVIDRIGDKGNLDDRLKQIHASIPHESKITKVNNKKVDENVFSQQRRELSQIKKDADNFINICS